MARQDLITCFKNALERGNDPSEIKRSLLNAGYPREDIEEAAIEMEKIEKRSSPDVPPPRFIPKLPR
ncbi:MAG: hypothetical protein NTX24_00425 [Candidatus Pacearchaeota archaeon]|nr:hypothetical protein [Candidatus Pacearchaeota archaeon]